MPKPASPQFLATLGRALDEGVALQRQGKLADAEKIYNRILKTLPGQFDALQLLAEVKMQRGKAGEAFRLMSAAVKARPNSPDAHVHLGHVLRALKRDADALASYDKALALDPQSIDALGSRADVLLTLRRPAEALAGLDRILAAAPGHLEARAQRGVALAALGRHDEGLAEFDAALRAGPNPIVIYNRGLTLAGLGRNVEAVEAYDRTLTAIPNYVAALMSRGVALHALNRHAEALASFDRALALAPDYADVHFNRSLALLAVGDYRAGQAEYEWRWKRSGAVARQNLGRPLWLGETPLSGKTLLLQAEQGLGDTLQFVRYVPRLAAGGAKIILEVHPELKALLSRLPGVAAVIAFGEARPPFDLHCPLGSLPFALKTELASVPADIPYLAAEPARIERWRPRLDALGRPRVAIVWAGNAAHANDRNRSLPLAKLSPLWAHGHACFVSLQRDLRPGEAEALAAAPVLHLGRDLVDFDDTAAVLACCDLVIAVDTSVAHLAGALGRPLWVLLPFSADWRWTKDADHSPWYPSARLYRESRPGDWDDVMGRVAKDLADKDQVTKN
ncbi:MAG TPA: tetratricopeptide repeat protein [Xanthobacteraceae bacterium]|jgi:tetratricopeptide (TPR) repeat protein